VSVSWYQLADHVIELTEGLMANRKGNDSDRYVQPRAEGGWEVVKERHERASAVTRTKAQATERAREIVGNLGGGEVRIKNLHNRFADSDTQGRRKESPARDRR
jgi:hypothetical protein